MWPKELLTYKKENESKTVVVGMSGGVDSSVAALVLKEQGYRTIGLFMKNWDELDPNGQCPAARDYEDVAAVCEQIGIPYYSVEFVKEYQENVFKHFLRDYERGFTPNPDILCNREIKFRVFFEKAMELGADYLATGHYAQILQDQGRVYLQKGADPSKDQSYFLYTLKEEILKKVLFPIGGIHKSQLRELAKEFGLKTSLKKDSTGICFIGERDFREFLSRYIKSTQGEFRTLSGTKVGTHMGTPYYTMGQRKGLGLGGAGEPWFVVGKDVLQNIVYVERGEHHPALYYDELWASDLTWVSGQMDLSRPLECKAKIRYRQKDQDCTVTLTSEGLVHVRFKIPQRAVAPRQSIVFYQDQKCLGGAVIERGGETYWQQNRPLPQLIAI